jgi:hypothetical protein
MVWYPHDAPVPSDSCGKRSYTKACLYLTFRIWAVHPAAQVAFDRLLVTGYNDTRDVELELKGVEQGVNPLFKVRRHLGM